MARNLVCSECGGAMQDGWMPMKMMRWAIPFDMLYWIEGKPQKDYVRGFDARGKQKHDIIAYRCERCGFMKFYAGSEHSAEKQ